MYGLGFDIDLELSDFEDRPKGYDDSGQYRNALLALRRLRELLKDTDIAEVREILAPTNKWVTG